MKRIGLVGGTSPESTLYYYRKYLEISRERFEPHTYPELVVYSINFKDFLHNPRGWEGRKEILISAAKALERAGAEIIALTANTPHIVFPDVQKAINTPMVSIIDALIEEMRKRGVKKVLLLGTKTTMTADFYRRALEGAGFEVVTPEDGEMNELDRIIKEELMFENFASRDWILSLINRYVSEGVDGVILGCTELPLVVKPGDVDAEVFDTVEIHMRKLIELASD
jgi:aspartate racemase